MTILQELDTDSEKADALQSVLLAKATGEAASDHDYAALRQHFINSPYAHLLPTWLKSKRTLGQFWPFIQTKFETYRERRAFIYEELAQFTDAVESNAPNPVEQSMGDLLTSPSHETVIAYWIKCNERVESDPEGAVTAARTLIETVLKHIVSDLEIPIDKNHPDLPELYSAVANHLSLSPQNHKEKLVKGILSGCNTIVSGIGELRNLYGDSHGKDQRSVRIEPRHAHLAVNLAGSMASFLMSTAKKHTNR
jgi:hypothetical protein